MKTHNTLDNIDIELSKTYFNNSQDRSTPGKRKHKGTRSRRGNRLIFFAIVLIVIGALAFLAAYFMSDKHITFNVAINIEPSPEARINAAAVKPDGSKIVLYDFETDTSGWEIPGWAQEKPDHVARTIKQTHVMSSTGTGSLEIYTEFPGNGWTAAIVEIQQYLDLSSCGTLSADIYVPEGAPTGLRGKFIVTVWDEWRFVEMSRGTQLKPGKWTTIKANISDGSMDWKRISVNNAFRQDIRKIAIRVESNRDGYSGPIYLDNVWAE